MEDMVVDGVIPSLPEEIITNILKRFPVKSLIRLQLVCKHWKYLIKTPYFITNHLHHSSNQNPSLLLRPLRPDPSNFFRLDCDMQVLDVLKAPSISNLCCASIIGSCNGLLCGKSSSSASSCSSLFLWNPATREVRWLPGVINDNEGRFYFGFGFSLVVNDYKIVKALVNSDNVINGVEVYSLNTDSWRKIEFGNLKGVKFFWQNVTANGSIFWSAIKVGEEEEGKRTKSILSFHIATEVFSLMPLPILYSPLMHVKFTVYDDKLTLLCLTGMENFGPSTLDLWVMEESTSSTFGKGWSWTKKYSSSRDPVVLVPLTIWRNEIVSNVCAVPVLDSTPEPESIISLSNLSTTEIETLTISRGGGGIRYVLNYVESIVPISNIHIAEHRS